MEVEREPRQVTVYSIELKSFTGDSIEIAVACSKGTYIRTIADDLGEKLGCGAHIVQLRRTCSGVFEEDRCISIDTLKEIKASDGLQGIDEYIVPMGRSGR